MINFKTIIRIIGILLLLETVMFLVCSGVSFYYRESDMLDFWKAGGITAGVGLLLAALGKGGERQLTRRDGYVLVSFAWVAFSLFGMLPFYIGRYIPDIANAFFETMSGFSSTGATILDDIESLPHGILFWRSMTQWIGGLGIIMFTIAVLPIFGVSGLQVFAAEASGPTHDKVHPRIGITAKWIWSIYAGITALPCLYGTWLHALPVCHSIFMFISIQNIQIHQQCRAEILFRFSCALHCRHSHRTLLYQSHGDGRILPQILVPSNFPPYIHRFCDR